jgi:prepilin-type N-terminal cleavage/methylation domain-containing protein
MRARPGFTLLEMMVVVAITAVLVAMASNSLTEVRNVSRVASQARLIVQRLQTARTNAVSQGNAQGYYFGPNGPTAGGPDANQSYVFVLQNATASNVVYNPLVDRADNFRDTLPMSGAIPVISVTGTGVVQPNPFQVGFDINGQATVTPAPGVWPYCIRVTDPAQPAIARSVILFNDGTVKVQKDETWCP